MVAELPEGGRSEIHLARSLGLEGSAYCDWQRLCRLQPLPVVAPCTEFNRFCACEDRFSIRNK